MLERANRRGVEGCLVPAYGPREWKRQEELLAYPQVKLGLGIHPWCVPELDHRGVLLLDKGFERYSSRWGQALSAVGEFGLDRSKSIYRDCFAQQRSLFIRHLELANRKNLPVIIHVVKAHGEALELLSMNQPSRGGVLHSYSGSVEMIERYAKLGLSFSYSGNLKQNRAKDCLLATPPERLLFETDGPYGRSLLGAEVTEPSELPEVVSLAAQILGRSAEWCWARHCETWARIFDPPE